MGPSLPKGVGASMESPHGGQGAVCFGGTGGDLLGAAGGGGTPGCGGGAAADGAAERGGWDW